MHFNEQTGTVEPRYIKGTHGICTSSELRNAVYEVVSGTTVITGKERKSECGVCKLFPGLQTVPENWKRQHYQRDKLDSVIF
jgi:hypothetical protein